MGRLRYWAEFGQRKQDRRKFREIEKMEFRLNRLQKKVDVLNEATERTYELSPFFVEGTNEMYGVQLIEDTGDDIHPITRLVPYWVLGTAIDIALYVLKGGGDPFLEDSEG